MSRHTWKLDNKLTAMMVEDMQFDPILAAKVLLRLRIPPHEELRILWMWTTYYTNDDSGFSTGKSFTTAIVSALRSILFPNRTSGVLSKTFSQGKLIFKNYEKWYHSSPIFRHCISVANGKPRILHSNDAHEVHFRGQSLIRVLPPALAQDAERLKSERWNDGYFDEWTSYGNFEAFNTTIIGRVTKENDYQDCPVRQNHIHLSSTPNFTHMPAYRIVKRIQANIQAGNKDYGRFTCNYRMVPKTKEWRWLINRKVIFTMQTTLPIGVVRSEIDGLWQEDSLSFYSVRSIQDVRRQVSVVLKRQRDEFYVGAFDTARGSERGSGDDFALTILRIAHRKAIPKHCLTIRKHNITAKQMSGIIHEVHRNLSLALLLYDIGGGGTFVRDELRDFQQRIRNEDVQVMPIIGPFDNMGIMGDPILLPIRRSMFFIQQLWGKMSSDNVLVNRIHTAFRMAISEGSVELAPEWSGWENIRSQWDVDAKRNFMNKSPGFKEEDTIRAEMDIAVDQLIMVDVLRDGNGMPLLDSHSMYKFKSKEKKDSAYSLAYAYLAFLLWQVMEKYGLGSQGGSESVHSLVISDL